MVYLASRNDAYKQVKHVKIAKCNCMQLGAADMTLNDVNLYV